jgi:hypothetical protein
LQFSIDSTSLMGWSSANFASLLLVEIMLLRWWGLQNFDCQRVNIRQFLHQSELYCTVLQCPESCQEMSIFDTVTYVYLLMLAPLAVMKNLIVWTQLIKHSLKTRFFVYSLWRC